MREIVCDEVSSGKTLKASPLTGPGHDKIQEGVQLRASSSPTTV